MKKYPVTEHVILTGKPLKRNPEKWKFQCNQCHRKMYSKPLSRINVGGCQCGGHIICINLPPSIQRGDI